jgi:threonine/homoserine/homoserine lactone efflux protein
MPAYLSLLGKAMLLGFAVAAPLGPTGATAIRQGLASGAWVAFWIGMGAALTDFVYIALTYAGLAPLLLRLPWITPLLYGIGAIVLGRMAIGAIREAITGGTSVAVTADDDDAPVSRPRGGWSGALLLGVGVTVVNPATITSWLSIGGAFVASDLVGRSRTEALGAMIAIMAGSAIWFSILAGIVGVARASIGRLPWLFRLVALLSGTVLLAFALLFAWRAVTDIL